MNDVVAQEPICHCESDHNRNRPGLSAVGLPEAAIASNHRLERQRSESVMASLTIRSLSEESKENLRRRAEQRGCSLEALVRSILEEAASDTIDSARFPYNLIAMVEPGEGIEPVLRDHDQPQERVDLP